MAINRSAAYRPAALIPVYNHPATVEAVVSTLIRQKIPVIVVDDGSDAPAREACDRCMRLGATVLHRKTNGGKGAALITGFRAAAKSGFTHVIQIDADGQHDSSAVAHFLTLSRKYPDALICGYPQYDGSVPAARFWGRKLTNFWVAVNSLSMSVADAMCGMRVYPVAAALQITSHANIGKRMEFDPEILVRLIWMGVRIKNLPVAVTYPSDGVSHFDAVSDNARISLMHAKLFVLMLTRFPFILCSRITGWAAPAPVRSPGAERPEVRR
ncbi:MAG: glycosyltransferase family 2 protein [Sutterella sp.]|nr:glycosyltransferase family 2 protein [Sutterella sp.]